MRVGCEQPLTAEGPGGQCCAGTIVGRVIFGGLVPLVRTPGTWMQLCYHHKAMKVNVSGLSHCSQGVGSLVIVMSLLGHSAPCILVLGRTM